MGAALRQVHAYGGIRQGHLPIRDRNLFCRCDLFFRSCFRDGLGGERLSRGALRHFRDLVSARLGRALGLRGQGGNGLLCGGGGLQVSGQSLAHIRRVLPAVPLGRCQGAQNDGGHLLVSVLGRLQGPGRIVRQLRQILQVGQMERPEELLGGAVLTRPPRYL